MSAESALQLARQRHVQVQLRSRVTIHRKDPDRTQQDESTGREAPVWAQVATDVPSRLNPKGSRRLTVGGVSIEQGTPEMDLPATQYDLEDGDVLEVTAGEWVGHLYEVDEAIQGDRRNVRRVPVLHLSRRPSGL